MKYNKAIVEIKWSYMNYSVVSQEDKEEKRNKEQTRQIGNKTVDMNPAISKITLNVMLRYCQSS